ncbi:glycosyltransferase, partial [Vibrio parahaemolyticus]
LPGYVSDGELAWLYGNCRAFLFFSRGEGFGLPPLEALLAGAEVVASDIPVMREIPAIMRHTSHWTRTATPRTRSPARPNVPGSL